MSTFKNRKYIGLYGLIEFAQVTTMTRDLRKYSRQTSTRLIIGGIALFFIVGGGLIYLFYGREAAMLGLVCLLVGLSPLVLIWGFLWGLGVIARVSDRE